MITVTTSMFTLQQLIKRDFTKKYKRTALGFAWSILSPLLMLLVMDLVFSFIFKKDIPHYTTFLFSGYIQFQYFSSSTSGTMLSLSSNAHILNKINIDKKLIVISESVSYLLSYLCTLLVYLLFAYIDGIVFTARMFWIIIPILYQIIFTFAVGMIVSVVFVFIRDLKYVYPVLMRITMYASAIFYSTSIFPAAVQKLYWFNPLYLSVYYLRSVMIEGVVPSYTVHLGMLTVLDLTLGAAYILYKKLEDKVYLYL